MISIDAAYDLLLPAIRAGMPEHPELKFDLYKESWGLLVVGKDESKQLELGFALYSHALEDAFLRRMFATQMKHLAKALTQSIEPYSEATLPLPLAVATGATAAIIRNPTVTRRFWK